MKEFDKLDLLKSELFECLLPAMVYRGEAVVRELVLDNLESEYQDSVYKLFERLCEEDGINCPYTEEAFKIDRVEEGGLQFIIMSLPESHHKVNQILRAYIVYAWERKNPEKRQVRFFYIKRFCNNDEIYVMYVSPTGEIMLGDEVTNYMGDVVAERRIVARSFIVDLLNELQLREVGLES